MSPGGRPVMSEIVVVTSAASSAVVCVIFQQAAGLPGRQWDNEMQQRSAGLDGT